MKINKDKRIHFVGIGGIGMSGIARVLLEMGYKVSGSDLETNDLTRRIEVLGGSVFEGHSASNLSADVGCLVYSTSIAHQNPEVAEAARRGIPIIHRAEILSEIFNAKSGIAVTGTHGKTTTTSFISVILKKTGLDPTVVIGGEVAHFDGNSSCGSGGHFVAEADESDGSFIHLRPLYAVLTNLEPEHLDHYESLDDIKISFRKFIDNVREEGTVVYCRDDMNVRHVLDGYKGRTLCYGFSEDADIYPADIQMTGFNTVYKCVYRNRTLGTVRLKIPGRHNILNSLAAILVSLDLGLEFKKITQAVRAFSGAKRRFQLRTEANGIMLIDDYAHHPTEIRAVLDACRNWPDRRVITIFQPHRYTRTKYLADEFGVCFKGTDKLILTDIYPASEAPIEGVSIKTIYDRVRASGLTDVNIVAKEEIADYVMKLAAKGDIVLVLGAGNIKKVADELSERLQAPSSSDRETTEYLQKAIRGNVRISEPLAGRTSFRIGGPADIWVEPADVNDLKKIVAFARKNNLPVFVIGNGSNLLVNDSGFRGMVIRLSSPAFTGLSVKGTTLRAGAGGSLPVLIKFACEKSLAGLESLAGIPGTVGGAVYMNAGGSMNPMYKNIGELITSVKVMDFHGRVRTIKKGGLNFGYRRSNLKDCVILEVALKLVKGERAALTSSCIQFIKIKKEKQTLDLPSAGCIFKNPPNFQFTCGQMIDMLGLKGKRIGGAEISDKHANFIINNGGASSRDIMEMIDLVKNKVMENYKVPLELEIKII